MGDYTNLSVQLDLDLTGGLPTLPDAAVDPAPRWAIPAGPVPPLDDLLRRRCRRDQQSLQQPCWRTARACPTSCVARSAAGARCRSICPRSRGVPEPAAAAHHGCDGIRARPARARTPAAAGGCPAAGSAARCCRCPAARAAPTGAGSGPTDAGEGPDDGVSCMDGLRPRPRRPARAGDGAADDHPPHQDPAASIFVDHHAGRRHATSARATPGSTGSSSTTPTPSSPTSTESGGIFAGAEVSYRGVRIGQVERARAHRRRRRRACSTSRTTTTRSRRRRGHGRQPLGRRRAVRRPAAPDRRQARS